MELILIFAKTGGETLQDVSGSSEGSTGTLKVSLSHFLYGDTCTAGCGLGRNILDPALFPDSHLPSLPVSAFLSS